MGFQRVPSRGGSCHKARSGVFMRRSMGCIDNGGREVRIQEVSCCRGRDEVLSLVLRIRMRVENLELSYLIHCYKSISNLLSILNSQCALKNWTQCPHLTKTRPICNLYLIETCIKSI